MLVFLGMFPTVDSLTVGNANESLTLKDRFYVASVKGVEFRWDFILTYIALWFLQGGGLGSMGFLNNVRSFLWIYVQQYTTRSVACILTSKCAVIRLLVLALCSVKKN